MFRVAGLPVVLCQRQSCGDRQKTVILIALQSGFLEDALGKNDREVNARLLLCAH